MDYLVFNALGEFDTVVNALKVARFHSPKIITLEQFNALPTEFFCDADAERQIINQLKNFSVKTLLDVDGYFAKGRLFTKSGNDFTAIDCISDKPLLPIKENFYAHIYKNFSEVGFKRYDAALIVERPPQDFIAAFTFLENFSDRVITFARNGSDLERYIADNMKNFSAVNGFRTMTGSWFFLTRHKQPEDFCIYVVTHKPTPHEGKLPEGYKIIHAGRALNADLGYLGDNTGDNISHLNPYINEITALYWFWKNTTHTVVGLCHYRRFFTESDDTNFAYEKILTRDAALKILRDYDIITVLGTIGNNTLTEAIVSNVTSEKPVKMFIAILKKYLLQVQPDYLDAFERVFANSSFYNKNMFVTRRDVFDAYGKWLFSFFLDAAQELLRTIPLHEAKGSSKRLMGYFAEHMHTVWLMKNHLRIKELNFMFINGI